MFAAAEKLLGGKIERAPKAAAQPPTAPVEFPSAQEILKSSDEDLQSTKPGYGDAQVAALAQSMTEDQLKQAETIISQDRQSKAKKIEDLKKNLAEGKITQDEFFQQQLNLQMAYGKAKIFTDVFAFLERPAKAPEAAAAPPAAQTGRPFHRFQRRLRYAKVNRTNSLLTS